LKKYSDYNKVSSWAINGVEGVIEKGYMGQGITAFRPKDNITRAEAVVTINRVK
ncbi:MAG: S-layer homology domain-containing protein, partial [Culicoidibacterales bacterium]